MGIVHTYRAGVIWDAADGVGTAGYTTYSRDHEVTFEDKSPLPGSADPAFRGDPGRYNPEELLVAALSQCHMLWFLHLASRAGIVVRRYQDQGKGHMRVRAAGHGQFSEVVLRPTVLLGRATDDAGQVVTDEALAGLHASASQHCFIARSVNFRVRVDPAPLQVAART